MVKLPFQMIMASFYSNWGDDVNEICSNLERLRAEFEAYDEDGNMVGLSQKGVDFLQTGSEGQNGYSQVYSEGASRAEDFIYDIQDEWNWEF